GQDEWPLDQSTRVATVHHDLVRRVHVWWSRLVSARVRVAETGIDFLLRVRLVARPEPTRWWVHRGQGQPSRRGSTVHVFTRRKHGGTGVEIIHDGNCHRCDPV